jgi:hypothetical protein
VQNVKKIRGLNLPGTPRATSACYFYFIFENQWSGHAAVGVLRRIKEKGKAVPKYLFSV